MPTLPARLTDVAAGGACAAFGALAVIRHRKPLHPRGLVVPAVLERAGSAPPVGAAWLDEPGRSDGVARISRSIGLPGGWPDVWGLALRIEASSSPSGVADLLLSTTWSLPGARNVLALRRGLRPPLSCVRPNPTGGGAAVLIGVAGRDPELPSDRPALARRLAGAPWTLTLAVRRPGLPWHPFATLTLGGGIEGAGDGVDESGHEDLSFDPVLNPLPGLALPDPLAAIRAKAYAGARAGRHADADDLRRVPAAR